MNGDEKEYQIKIGVDLETRSKHVQQLLFQK